jgi:hypothetical protein
VHNLCYPPALFFGQRAGFYDANHVTRARLIIFVVYLIPLGKPDRLAVNAMSLESLYGNDCGLVHFVADDSTDALLMSALCICHGLSLRRQFSQVLYGAKPRDLPPNYPQLTRILQLPGGVLKPEREQLTMGIF